MVDSDNIGSDKAEGTKNDQDKLRFDLVPPEFLEGLAEVFTIGAKKYSDWNWTKGLKWSRVLAALHRHLNAWQKGYRYDSENAQHHMYSVAWCALVLAYYEKYQLGEDDRQCRNFFSKQYIAGIIDGEGCVSILKATSQDYMLTVSVGMCDPIIPKLLKEQYGGSITTYAPQGNKREKWVWAVRAKKAAMCLEDIKDELIIKYEQAILGLQFQKTKTFPGKKVPEAIQKQRLDYVEQIRKLNKRGHLNR